SAGALLGIPRVSRSAAEPGVAHGEFTKGELGNENSPRFVEPPHDSRGVHLLLAVRRRTPGGRRTGHTQQILCAPGNAMQRATITPGCDLAVGGTRLLHCPLLEK